MPHLLSLFAATRRPSLLSRLAGFGKRSIRPRRPRQSRRPIGIESLETRLALATFSSDASGLITIALGSGESLTGVSASVSSSSATTDIVTLNATTTATNSISGGLNSGLVLTGDTTKSIITYTAASNTAAVGKFTGISILGSSGTEAVTIGNAVDLATGNLAAAARFSVGSSLESLSVNAAITSKAANISLTSTAIVLSANLTASTSGSVIVDGPVTLSGSVSLTSLA